MVQRVSACAFAVRFSTIITVSVWNTRKLNTHTMQQTRPRHRLLQANKHGTLSLEPVKNLKPESTVHDTHHVHPCIACSAANLTR
jgi:hypothetical protein